MILLIDAFDSFTFNLAHAFRSLGADVQVRRPGGFGLAEARALAPRAVVLSPGPGHPAESGLHMAISASAWEVPVLGVCLGHQALIAASGGHIGRAQRPQHGEATPCRHDGTGLFAGVPPAVLVGRYHSLVADPASLPDCWRVSAFSPAGEIMAVEHVRRPRWGVQFHPESILTPDGPRILANFLRLAHYQP